MSKLNETEKELIKDSDTQSNISNTSEKNKRKTLKDTLYAFFIFTNPIVDIFVYLLIAFAFYCSFLMYNGLEAHQKLLQSYDPNWRFPKTQDLAPAFWMFLILIFVHKIFKVLTIDFIERHLSK